VIAELVRDQRVSIADVLVRGPTDYLAGHADLDLSDRARGTYLRADTAPRTLTGGPAEVDRRPYGIGAIAEEDLDAAVTSASGRRLQIPKGGGLARRNRADKGRHDCRRSVRRVRAGGCGPADQGDARTEHGDCLLPAGSLLIDVSEAHLPTNLDTVSYPGKVPIRDEPPAYGAGAGAARPNSQTAALGSPTYHPDDWEVVRSVLESASSSPGRLGLRTPGSERPVIFFFSNRLGCLGSLVVSAVATLVLLLVLGVIHLD
jgi:hypothetical protein